MSSIIKLGHHEINLRYDFQAFLRLDEECGLNAMSPASYRDFSPKQMVALVWAGQTSKKPLTRPEVAKLMPCDADNYLLIATAVADALGAAINAPDEASKDS
jgi:hypothetical protein